ncbi:MAG: YkgJ family cysteine cluster protein, partial [Sediminibacterium sp.]|nr:YkgJ family cysteine cluster protein [Sediminibacterium sp.]
DEEGDYVLPSLPCVFLDTNNYCQIYEVRPGDCKRFPYTDEDVFLKRTQISQKNAEFCPIVQNVMQQIIQNYSLKI